MANKDTDNSNYLSADDNKESNSKVIFSKFEYDLYHDEDNIINKVIRVKRFGTPAKGEKWKIYEDSKIVAVIDGNKLTKKEKMYLSTPDGFRFVISQYKQGNVSINNIKKNIKQYLK